MDTRFSPRPKLTKIPLYPSISDQNPLPCDNLKFKIAKFLEVSSDHILLSINATTSFLSLINQLYEQPIRIGLPAFFCPSFAYECIKLGHELVFYDLSKNLTLEKNSLNFLIEANCKVIIYPNFFNATPQNLQIIDIILRKDILLIIDEAQSFPISSPPIKGKCKNVVTLFSFGKSKPLAGIGGGGLCFHERSIDTPKTFKFTQQVNYSEHFSSLENLLQKRYGHSPKFRNSKYYSIDKKQESTAFYHWIQLEEKRINLIKNWTTLYNSLSKEILSFVSSSSNYPSILAIKVKNRYHVARRLADLGIETTWYYYPLSYLNIYKKFPTQDLVNTPKISKEILIVPWSLHHDEHHFQHLYKSLREVIDEYKDSYR